jgi:hypothetical protein
MLVERVQVLDPDLFRREGRGHHPANIDHQRTNDMDPAALGTLRIGLDTIRHDDELYARTVASRARPRSRLGFIRRLVAAVLRGAAERIAPSPAAA